MEAGDTELQQETEVMIHTFATALPISATKKSQLQAATAADQDLQQVRGIIAEGWPETIQDVPNGAKPYWTVRDEIHDIEGMLFKGRKIIIPESLRAGMLRVVHESHLGMEKCRERARAVMYWPNMTQHIDKTVSKCGICLQYQRSNVKEPMIPHSVPRKPWQKIAADIMTFGERDYLLIVDYFSKYVEMPILQDKTARSVIHNLKSVFSRHGIPEQLICDNMPFASRKIAKFAQEWGFTITTTSPTYPQSNSLAERNVQTMKQLLRKAMHQGTDPYLALLDFRASPITGFKVSPAELLMGRKLKTKLPIALTRYYNPCKTTELSVN